VACRERCWVLAVTVLPSRPTGSMYSASHTAFFRWQGTKTACNLPNGEISESGYSRFKNVRPLLHITQTMIRPSPKHHIQFAEARGLQGISWIGRFLYIMSWL
jgi:hypothetical protein